MNGSPITLGAAESSATSSEYTRCDWFASVVNSVTSVFFWAVLFGSINLPVLRPNAAELLPAADVISAVKQEIQAAAESRGEPRLILDLVEVELVTVAKTDVSGGLQVPLFKVIEGRLGGSVNEEFTQRLEFALVPAERTEVESSGGLGLAAAIEEAKKALQSALTDPPQLQMRDLVYSANFVVGEGAEGRIQFLLIGEIEGTI